MASRARSLRFKLALWFVLVFSGMQLVLVGGVVLLRRETVRRSLDASLTDSAKRMVDNILAAEVTWSDDALHALVPADAGFLFYAVRDEQGRILASHQVPDRDSLPFSAWEVVPSGPVGDVLTTLSPERAEKLTGTSGRLRLITVPFRAGGDDFFFQAGVHDRVLERMLGPFLDLVLLGVPVGIVAAFLAAWVIAGSAVSPIRRLSRAASTLSPASLGERFHVFSRHEEIARLQDELNSALERMEEGYKAQQQFISNVSHELKTPIAVLVTEAQVAKLGERSMRKGYDFVDMAESELIRLGKLVESFLVLARSELTRAHPMDDVSMNDVVLQCVQHCKSIAEQRKVKLIPNLATAVNGDPEPVVSGDPELLQTMVENLVRNAIAHSPRGGAVSIDTERADDEIRVVVSDEGPGIPDGYLERVFDRFFQVPRRGQRANGTGLGLAIASSLAELHEGAITARNNTTGGCSFSVSLPLKG